MCSQWTYKLPEHTIEFWYLNLFSNRCHGLMVDRKWYAIFIVWLLSLCHDFVFYYIIISYYNNYRIHKWLKCGTKIQYPVLTFQNSKPISTKFIPKNSSIYWIALQRFMNKHFPNFQFHCHLILIDWLTSFCSIYYKYSRFFHVSPFLFWIFEKCL